MEKKLNKQTNCNMIDIIIALGSKDIEFLKGQIEIRKELLKTFKIQIIIESLKNDIFLINQKISILNGTF